MSLTFECGRVLYNLIISVMDDEDQLLLSHVSIYSSESYSELRQTHSMNP